MLSPLLLKLFYALEHIQGTLTTSSGNRYIHARQIVGLYWYCSLFHAFRRLFQILTAFH